MAHNEEIKSQGYDVIEAVEDANSDVSKCTHILKDGFFKRLKKGPDNLPFAVCSKTNEPMSEGWYCEDQDRYFKYEKDALAFCQSYEYKSISKAYDDDFIYWSTFVDFDFPRHEMYNHLLNWLGRREMKTIDSEGKFLFSSDAAAHSFYENIRDKARKITDELLGSK